MVNLAGLRVLNTRPLEQAKELSKQLIQAGGKVLSCPALEIVASESGWLQALPALQEVAQAIFTSANAVNFCFPVLAQHAVCWPGAIKVTAIGQGTAEALKQQKIRMDHIPDTASSEDLLALDSLQQVQDQHILLFKGEGGRTLLRETLQQRGARLQEICVYKRLSPVPDPLQSGKISDIWLNQAVDIILFTSQQAMHNLFALFGEKAHPWLRQTPCLVISQRLAEAASNLGIKNIIICCPETIIPTLDQFRQGLAHDQRQRCSRPETRDQ